MHKGLVLALVAILGVSMVGVGHMTGSGNDNGNDWFSWWKNFDYKKFIGFMNTGGFGGNDDDDDDDNGNGPHDDVDQSPIDSATISFNIAVRELSDNSFQNIVDQCIFSSEESFDPLCVKCKFLDDANNVVAKGEIIELDQSYAANTEVPIPMTSVPEVPDGDPVNNDVRNVHAVNLSVCGFNCVPVYATFTDLKHGARQTAINTAMASSGITVSGDGNNGIDEVIIFDADKSGTNDPDLEVDNGLHILILPETGTFVDTNPADGYIDSPNDAAAGGTITVKMDTAFFLKSFVLVDHENDHVTDVAKAYSDHAGLNLVKTVKLPVTGNGQFTTVTMNAANVKRLDVTYADSGGITNINLKCEPEEQNCTCEKPDKFVVKYHGPNGVTVEISKNGKDKVTLPGTFNDGDEIVVDAIALGFKNGKVYPETTYNFIKYGQSIGTISIHTSCSQTLYVGQEFFYHKGQSDEIQLTVVSGTLKGEPSIPDDASCPVNQPDCECKKPDKFTVLYNGPSGVKVEIYKNANDVGQSSKRLATLGPFNNGDPIVLDSNVNLGQTTVNANTVYNFIKNYKSVGVVSIHTSCSQPLFVGQEFFYHQGQSDQIKLTVESGTLKGSPSIPDESCPVPQDCDCDDRKDHYGKYYDDHKKYYDNNKNKFKSSDYKNYIDEHKKYLDDYGKYMDKSDYKKHTDYFKKFLDDNKKKFSSSDYKKYSDVHKKYSDDYKNHSDDCKCDTNDGKDHYDRDDHDKDDKDYKYKYGKDHDD